VQVIKSLELLVPRALRQGKGKGYREIVESDPNPEARGGGVHCGEYGVWLMKGMGPIIVNRVGWFWMILPNAGEEIQAVDREHGGEKSSLPAGLNANRMGA